MNRTSKLVVFHLDKQQFAIRLSNVDRIVRIVEIDPLPLAPEYILGTINYHGEFLPVVNIRKLFLLPQREIELTDQMIITSTTKTKVALWVDSVREIVELSDEDTASTSKVLLDVGYVDGLFKLRDGMVLIQDIDKFLTPEQIAKLSDALLKQRMKVEEKAKALKSPVVRTKINVNKTRNVSPKAIGKNKP